MMQNLLYAIGEFLAVETELVEDVRYVREEENVVYVLTKEGEKYKLIIENA